MTLLISYLVYLGMKRESPGEDELEEIKDRAATWLDGALLLGGFVAIALGGHLMVSAATSIASTLGVSSWVIGVTIVAAGTSLPELVTCLAASVKGKNEMLLGNLIGSDFFNFAGVLGLTCLLKTASGFARGFQRSFRAGRYGWLGVDHAPYRVASFPA